MLSENKACLRRLGTDVKSKMSKSLGNCIYTTDTSDIVKEKVMSMYTDPNHVRISDSGQIDGNTVFTYLDAFVKKDSLEKYLSEYKNLNESKDHYKRGGLGDVKIKKFLFNVLELEKEDTFTNKILKVFTKS